MTKFHVQPADLKLLIRFAHPQAAILESQGHLQRLSEDKKRAGLQGSGFGWTGRGTGGAVTDGTVQKRPRRTIP